MKVLQRSRRLARLAGCAALTVGLAGTAVAGSPPAQARVTWPTVDRHVAMFWGSNQSTPVQVTGLTGVTQVAAGGLHSLALRSDGTVWAWGDGGTGLAYLTPVQVTGLTGVTKISAGDLFSLALRSDGTVWAWGHNGFGQLGNGTRFDSSVPVQVAGLSHVTGISAGFDASLATRTRGITALTSVWTWGGNAYGQLGDGTFTDHLTPEQVTGINTPYIASISAGHHFAVVLGTDGSAWGWGADESGQLDNAPTSNPVTRPVQMTWTGSGITQLSAGYDHVLALESNGTVLAWGDNSAGELGDGGTTSTIGPVQVPGLTNVSQVSAGGQFSLAVHVPPWIVLAPAR